MQPIYEFEDYKVYLRKALKARESQVKGIRSRFAEAIRCRPGYVSQILASTSDLSLEQAELANAFLGHSEREGDFFILLVMYARAGNNTLKARILKQIRRQSDSAINLKSNLRATELSQEEKALVLSDWLYQSIILLVNIPGFQSPVAVAKYCGVPLSTVTTALEVLAKLGLVGQKKDGKLFSGINHSSVDRNSRLIVNMNTCWRLQAIQSIERNWPKLGHATTLFSISKQDREVIHHKLRKCLDEIDEIIRLSSREELYCLNIDFFNVGRDRVN
ncbi:MAG: TIGR02147 family protein [Bdellovibrionales bacterium]